MVAARLGLDDGRRPLREQSGERGLQVALADALKDPEVNKHLLDLGFEIVANTPEEFTAFQASEFARWKKVIEVGKITAD